jgi:phage terminase large subunit
VLFLSSTVSDISHSYFIYGISISHQDSACVDLGVTINRNLVVSRAQQRASILFRGVTSRNSDTMRRAFIVYVRPIVECNSVVWSPYRVHLLTYWRVFNANLLRELLNSISNFA